MTIKIYVTTTDLFEVENNNTLHTLGKQEQDIAIQLQELFSSVIKEIGDSLEVESQLTIEITGSVSLKAKAGGQYLFFNAGAEAGRAGGMKVVLTTTVASKF